MRKMIKKNHNINETTMLKTLQRSFGFLSSLFSIFTIVIFWFHHVGIPFRQAYKVIYKVLHVIPIHVINNKVLKGVGNLDLPLLIDLSEWMTFFFKFNFLIFSHKTNGLLPLYKRTGTIRILMIDLGMWFQKNENDFLANEKSLPTKQNDNKTIK